MDILQLFIFLFGTGIILSILKVIFDLGGFNNRFTTLEDKFDKLEKTISPVTGCIQKLNHAVIEIQSCLHENAKFEFKHNIDVLSQSMSPIGLKDELKPLVHNSGLDKLIDEKKTAIIAWLKAQKPPTGMDAQDKIIKFILSGKVEKYLNLKKY